jgi:hypothetical protein
MKLTTRASSAKVKNEWSYKSASHYKASYGVDKDNFIVSVAAASVLPLPLPLLPPPPPLPLYYCYYSFHLTAISLFTLDSVGSNDAMIMSNEM